jgi:hypothetical protein
MTRSLVISAAGYGHGPVSRAGEALHLAVADNHRATVIYSLDKTLLKAGKILGLPVSTGIRAG